MTSRSGKRSAEEGTVSPPPIRRKVESTTTKKAVAGFFTPASKKEPEKTTWKVVNATLLAGRYRTTESSGENDPLAPRRKIAAFDFDSTLISPSSGNIIAKDATDWKWWDAVVPSVLKQLYVEGYLVAILSNQGSIGLKSDPKTIKRDQKSLANFKSKANSVFSQLDIPITLLAAAARDQYRKPRTAMWKELLEDSDLDVGPGPDLDASFFVGDAGGRAARGRVKADHSCCDRNFAANIGITFKTPEEFFLHERPVPFSRDFEPTLYLDAAASTSLDASPLVIQKSHDLDIVIFCGCPGSGKSSFYWKHLQPLGYVRVNQDTLKSREGCLKVASSFLTEGKPVAVDNTNADPDTRAVWIQLAQKFQVPVRCLYFTAPLALCEHNDTVRALAGSMFNPEKRAVLPHSAFSGFASRFKAPKVTEGFGDVLRIEFQFQGDVEQRRIWSQYWI